MKGVGEMIIRINGEGCVGEKGVATMICGLCTPAVLRGDIDVPANE